MPMPNFDALLSIAEPAKPAPISPAMIQPGPLATTVAPRPMPSPVPAPHPQGGGWQDLISAFAPMLGALAMGGGAKQSGFMEGFNREQAIMAEERQKRQAAEQDRKAKAAKFVSDVLAQADQIPDPNEWAQHINRAAEIGMQSGLLEDASELKSLARYPAGLAKIKRQKDALDKLDAWAKRYGGWDRAPWDRAMTGRWSIAGEQISDLATIAAAFPQDVEGRFQVPTPQANLMAVAPGASLVDKNKPGAGPVFTAPEKPKDEKLYEVTVPGPNGKPVKKLVPASELQGGGVPVYERPRVGGGVTAIDDLPPPKPAGSMTMAQVPEADRAYVQGMLEYRLPMPTGYALARSPVWMRRVDLATAVDPTFDVTQYAARQKARGAFTSGKEAQNIRGLNTAVGHINSLVGAAEELKNSNWSDANTALNVLAKHLPVTPGLQARQGTTTNIRAKFNAVTGELASIFKQSGATDQEIASWKNTVGGDPAAATPKQWKAFVDGALELMGSRMQALTNSYEVAMGKPKDFRLLSPQSRAILKKLGQDVDAMDPIGAGAKPDTAAGGPRIGERRMINGKLGEWDGKGWRAVP